MSIPIQVHINDHGHRWSQHCPPLLTTLAVLTHHACCPYSPRLPIPTHHACPSLLTTLAHPYSPRLPVLTYHACPFLLTTLARPYSPRLPVLTHHVCPSLLTMLAHPYSPRLPSLPTMLPGHGNQGINKHGSCRLIATLMQPSPNLTQIPLKSGHLATKWDTFLCRILVRMVMQFSMQVSFSLGDL